MYSLRQIHEAIHNLQTEHDLDETLTHLEVARAELAEALNSMDKIPVVGRGAIDTLLGCMMAVEQIIGEDKNG